MNKVILIGRLTKDPVMNEYGELHVARYTLAVDRPKRKDAKEGQPTADFIGVKTFGKGADFAFKWLKKGTKIAIVGKIETGSYEKDGQKVYTTDVVAEQQEFVEKLGTESADVPQDPKDEKPQPAPLKMGDDFLDIPADVEAELPFA